MFKRFRSSRTGLYVSRAEAEANRDTTTAEQADRSREELVLWDAIERCIERNGLDATLERLAD